MMDDGTGADQVAVAFSMGTATLAVIVEGWIFAIGRLARLWEWARKYKRN